MQIISSSIHFLNKKQHNVISHCRMNEKHKKILIINTFGIGDVLFSTPLVRMLKMHIPESTIDFVCNERTQYILQNNKNINELIIFEKDKFRELFRKSKIRFIKKMYEFIKRIKSKQYDLAVDLSLGYQTSLLLKLLGVKKRIGFNFRNRGKFLTDKLNIEGFNKKHVVEYYLDVLSLIGIIDCDDRQLELGVSEEVEQWAERFINENNLNGKVLIGLAPGGWKKLGRGCVI